MSEKYSKCNTQLVLWWTGAGTPSCMIYMVGNHTTGFIFFCFFLFFLILFYEMASGNSVVDDSDGFSDLDTNGTSVDKGKVVKKSAKYAFFIGIGVTLIQVYFGQEEPESFFENAYYEKELTGFITWGEYDRNCEQVKVVVSANMGSYSPEKIIFRGRIVEVIEEYERGGLTGGLSEPIFVSLDTDDDEMYTLYIQKN